MLIFVLFKSKTGSLCSFAWFINRIPGNVECVEGDVCAGRDVEPLQDHGHAGPPGKPEDEGGEAQALLQED